MTEIRLLPLVIVAIGALLALKGVGLMVGEPHLVGGSGPALAQEDTAAAGATQDAGAQPEAADGEPGGQAMAAAEDPANAGGADAGQGADGDVMQNGDKDPAEAKADEPSLLQRVLGGKSRARDAVLESLAERREQLDAREKEIDLRENLLKATEQRVEQRIAELKALESELEQATEQRTDEENERLKNVVTMYETMKPKDAARIFDTLDMDVVVDVASKMSARQMALVLAEMDSQVAQRLTIELSAKPEAPAADPVGAAGELPKIMGTRPAN